MSFPDMMDSIAAPSWDHTRSVVAARILVEVGEQHGVTARAVLSGTGLRSADLQDPELEIEAGQELAIARNLLRRLDDRPGLGVEAGRRYTLGGLGVWGFALLTSPTVRDMVRLGTRYAGLSFAFIRPVYLERADAARVVFDDSEIPDDVRAFFVERELAKLLVLAPAVIGNRYGFHVETAFTGGRALALRRIAGGNPVVSDAGEHALVFAGELLDKALPQADPVTGRALEAQCAELLQRRQRRRGIGAHVRSRLLSQLDRQLGIEQIAAEMHVDERTLRRKLAAEGTSFRELADEVRSTMALELLGDGQLTIQEVAARLGYHDAAAFSRAFKRWTGERPGEFRTTTAVASGGRTG